MVLLIDSLSPSGWPRRRIWGDPQKPLFRHRTKRRRSYVASEAPDRPTMFRSVLSAPRSDRMNLRQIKSILDFVTLCEGT